MTMIIRDADNRLDARALVVAEAVLLHHALDEFVHGQVAQEDGPVVDFGFGGADVDAEGYYYGGKKSQQESVNDTYMYIYIYIYIGALRWKGARI